MDSLGGSSKALMFACCSPAGSYLEETLNTLQYAARTRNITNKPAVQVDPHEELVRELRKEMKLLKTQNAQLHYALQRCAQVDMNKVKFEVMKPWITREMSHQTRPAQLRPQRGAAACAQSE